MDNVVKGQGLRKVGEEKAKNSPDDDHDHCQ